MKILVTGASGFVGRHLVQSLRQAGHAVKTAGLSNTKPLDFRIPLGPSADWSAAVRGCDAVVHAGGRAHVMNKAAAQATSTFNNINVTGTLTLVQTAIAAGVQHFVFISSIAALGDVQSGPARETDTPTPATAYGQSKLSAEQGLMQLSEGSELIVTCLRPPLIYGPDAGGRFRQMLRWCGLGLPLPLASINNQRSYLAIENLADAIQACLSARSLARGIYNLADDGTLSTPELLELIGIGLGKPARLFAVPPIAFHAMRRLGLSQPIDKLSQTLVLDTTKFKTRLNWTPPTALRIGIIDTARTYRTMANK